MSLRRCWVQWYYQINLCLEVSASRPVFCRYVLRPGTNCRSIFSVAVLCWSLRSRQLAQYCSSMVLIIVRNCWVVGSFERRPWLTGRKRMVIIFFVSADSKSLADSPPDPGNDDIHICLVVKSAFIPQIQYQNTRRCQWFPSEMHHKATVCEHFLAWNMIPVCKKALPGSWMQFGRGLIAKETLINELIYSGTGL